MKTAIVYYSMSGNTAYVAEKVAAKLRETEEVDIIKIEPEKAFPDKGFKMYFWGGKSAVMKETPALQSYEFDVEKYDRIIFGTPVWASTFAPPLRTFVEENSDVKKKKLAMFVCYAGSGAEKTFARFKKFMDVADLEAELILLDPKDKVKTEDDVKIEEFCEKLR